MEGWLPRIMVSTDIALITKNINHFCGFVSMAEYFSDYSNKLSKIWLPLELLNADALEDVDVYENWNIKYQQEAIKLTTEFLNELELFFDHIVNDIVNNEEKFHRLFNLLENDDYFKSKFSSYWNELDTLYFIFNDDREMFVDKYKNELIDLLLKIIHFYPYKFLDVSSN